MSIAHRLRAPSLSALLLAAVVASPRAVAATGAGEPAEKSGVGAQAIALPQGAGTVSGMGESFSMQPSTGAATLRIPIQVPPARGGVQPAIALGYASSRGRGVAGEGWSLASRFIARQTDRGTPQYDDPPPESAVRPGQDRFVTSEGQELVPICRVSGGTCAGAVAGEAMPSWAEGWIYFRAEIEGAFARFFWSPDRRTWRVQPRGGGSLEYGVPLDGSGDTNALEADPLAPSHVFQWDLSRAYDGHGAVNGAPGDPVRPPNVARYRYVAAGNLAYLADVYDTPPAAAGDSASLDAWAHHVHVAYETRPDTATSYRRGYLTNDTLRVAGIDVTSKTFGGDASPRELVRRYRTTYDPGHHVSLLASVRMEGRCAAPTPEDASGLLPPSTGCPTLPPMTFEYTHVRGGAPSDLAGYEAFDETMHAMSGSPKLTVDGQRADFFDVNADGLPDVLATDVTTFGAQHGVFFAGLGGAPDTFTAATAAVHGVLNDTSVSLALSNATVVPIDFDGNGVTDLLHMPRAQTYAVYTPVAMPGGGWAFEGRVVRTPNGASPLVDFTANAGRTRTMDVDGDGVLDVVTTNGGAYQTFFGLARYPGGSGQFGTATWTSTTEATIATQSPAVSCMPWSSVAVQLGDPDQKIADMNGDGLPDIVRVRPGDVRYWPGRGNGFWGTGRRDDCPKGTIASGRDVGMTASPSFPGAPGPSMRLRDVNGDGLDDLVQIRNTAIDVWLNVDGVGFTPKPHTIQTGTAQPNLQANARMRFLDVNGSGTVDLVWGEGYKYQYMDLAGGERPALLARYANGLGKTTELTYASSTALMLAARRAGQPWSSVTPTPIHVLTAVTEREGLAMLGRTPSAYVREYVYRDPVYDGRQREFRGFRSVRAIERGEPGSPTSITDTTYLLGECVDDAGDAGPSPCTADGAWRANPREALKGLPLVTERRDENGVVLSTTHTTYRLRRLYDGLDGRDVREAFASESDTFLYDTARFTPAESTVRVADVEVDLGGSRVTEGGGITARAAFAHLRTRHEEDVFGDATTAIDDGCVEGCDAVDEAITTTQRFALPDGDASGWAYRAVESATTGSRHLGRTYHHTRTTYDAAGDSRAVDAELTGTLPLDRHHEDASQSIAPPPANASHDGWIRASSTEYDAFGNVVATRTAVGRCHRVSFDAAYATLAVAETVLVGSAGTDGCGTTPLTAVAVYDRGLGKATMVVDVHGETMTATLDGFGRIAETRHADPAVAGLLDPYSSQQYEYLLPSDPAAMPWSAVHVTTHDATDVATQGTTETWTFNDGMGRVVAELRQADPAAGDGAAWIVDELGEHDRAGNVRRAFRPFFYGGDPRALPAVTDRPSSPVAERTYDAFGREVDQVAFDGTLVGRTEYHALAVDALDAEDLTAAAEATPTTTVRDGHGRTIATIERLHVGGGLEAHTTATAYLPTGDVESITRTGGGAAPVVRWMAYDSLGRRVLNVEPNASVAGAPGDVGAARAWRYAYDDDGHLVGTSDARGCGANYAYDAAGRLASEDYSPCLAAHAAYTPSAEVSYTYDAPPADAPPDFAATFLAGRMSAIHDRASESLSSYDGRGRLVGTARRLARPEGDGVLGRDWYVQSTAYDTLGRPVRASTGARSPDLMGSDGQSVVTTAYTKSGHVARVGGSYGPLVTDVARDATGLVLSIRLGDAAGTSSAFAYDARDRLTHAEARRTTPADGGALAEGAAYPLLLEANDFTYDALSRPLAIHDGRDAAEWPAGAKPVDRAMQYDDLGRLVHIAYTYAGDSTWTSPTAAEEAAPPGAGAPLPRVAFDQRVAWQSYAFDALGNVTRADDDEGGFYDRSLGAMTYGDAAHGPYQLRTATAASGHAGALEAAYDDAGNTTSIVVRRGGSCLPAGALCMHRFVYDWDEVGRLARARRWDLDDPGHAADALPTGTPAADLRFVYDASDTRVLKVATDGAGVTRVTASVFASLDVRQTTYEDGDYVRTATTEVPRLFAHGVFLGEARVLGEDVPAAASGRRRVFLRLADHLGSTGSMIDKGTGELVEQTTYLPYGATESDYRPARWGSFHEPYGFTGKEEDREVGLTYFGKRYLSPATMRWLSPDPLAVHGAGADLNVYAYVHGAVLTAVDPTGLAEQPTDMGAPPAMGAPPSEAAPSAPAPAEAAAPAAEAPRTAWEQQCPQCAAFLDHLQIDTSKVREGLNINDRGLRTELGLPSQRWTGSLATFPGYHVGKTPLQTETKTIYAIELSPDNHRDFNAAFFSLDKDNKVVGVHFGSIGTQEREKTSRERLTAGGLISGTYEYTVGQHIKDKYHGNFAVVIVSGRGGPGGPVPMQGPNNYNDRGLAGQYLAEGVHLHSAIAGGRASLGCLNVHNDQYGDFLSHFGSHTTGILTVVRYEDIRTFFPAR